LQFGPEGELDVFVSGNLTITIGVGLTALALGAPERPGALRFYVGGDQVTIRIGLLSFAGQIYAPNAVVVVAASLGMFGSIVGRDIVAVGPQQLHYDRSITETEPMCTTTDRCDRCDDCAAGSACVDGSCGPCKRDSDCCEPWVCEQGKCQALSTSP
jgi:hypothetical protein